MAYAADEKIPEDLFVQLLTEKANTLRKHLKHTHSSLVMCANIGPNMATFKLYNTKEEDSYIATMMEGMFIPLPTALDVKLCLIMNGHLCMFDQALYPVDHTKWCIYALFINDKN